MHGRDKLGFSINIPYIHLYSLSRKAGRGGMLLQQCV